MTKLLIAGFYGFGNTGDEAILSALLEHLRERLGKTRIVVCSGNPGRTREYHNIGSVFWRDIRAVVDCAEDADALIVGGGGLYQDYWGCEVEKLLSCNRWGISYYAGISLLGQLLNRPTMFYSVGVGPVRSRDGRLATRMAFEYASVATVRDAGSLTALHDAGVDTSRVRVRADPVFGLDLTAHGLEDRDVRTPAFTGEREPVLGVAVRHWNHGNACESWMAQVAKGLDEAVDNLGVRPVFIPFHVTGGDHDDRAIAHSLVAMMRHGGRCEVIDHELGPLQVAESIRGCQLFLTMRLHGVILAARTVVSTAALAYDPKVRETMSMLHCQDYCIELAQLDAAVLHDTLCHLLSQSQDVKRTVHEQCRSLYDSALLNAGLVADMLAGRPNEFETKEPVFLYTEAGRRWVLAQVLRLDASIGRVKRLERQLKSASEDSGRHRYREFITSAEIRQLRKLCRGQRRSLQRKSEYIRALTSGRSWRLTYPIRLLAERGAGGPPSSRKNPGSLGTFNLPGGRAAGFFPRKLIACRRFSGN